MIASGKSHTVRNLCESAFGALDLDWQKYVEQDPRYLRPSEVDHLRGDSSKAQRVLGWKPQVGFDELVRMMIDTDLKLAKREKLLRDAGLAERDSG